MVCAGVKSILDIPRTLEFLETQGVGVVGYGTDAFPAFFTTDSGCPAPMRMDSPQEIAELMKANRFVSHPTFHKAPHPPSRLPDRASHCKLLPAEVGMLHSHTACVVYAHFTLLGKYV